MWGKLLDKMWGGEKIVHRGYSPTERQIGHVYDGWRVVARRKIPRLLRWLYDATWEFIGVNDEVRYTYGR